LASAKRDSKEIKMRYNCKPWIQKRKEQENNDSKSNLFRFSDNSKGGRCVQKKFDRFFTATLLIINP